MTAEARNSLLRGAALFVFTIFSELQKNPTIAIANPIGFDLDALPGSKFPSENKAGRPPPLDVGAAWANPRVRGIDA
jgi:hypothetical protein